MQALDRDRCTPLMLACQSGAWEVGRKLLEAKADASAIGKDSWTAMREWGRVFDAAIGNSTSHGFMCIGGTHCVPPLHALAWPTPCRFRGAEHQRC